MARQVLPIVGAVVGAFFGAPQLGFAIGSIIGNAVDPLVVQGPKIGEAGLQTSAEGVYRPVVYGTAAVKGNVIERGNRQIKTERHQQGKGGPVTEEQRVYWTFAIRLCEGPIEGVARIWQDEKLVYDITPGSLIPAESAEFGQLFRLYLGDELQLPDPDIEAYRGIGNTPAYRGTAYIVFPNFDLTDRRESIPDFRFEVASSLAASDYPLIVGTEAYYTGEMTDLTRVDSEEFVGIATGGRKQIAMAGAGFVAGAYLAAPRLRSFIFNGTDWDAGTINGTLPPGAPQALAFSPDGEWLAVGLDVSPFLMLYRKTGNTLDFFANGSPIEDEVRFVKWSRDSSKLAVSVDSTRPVRLYAVSGDDFAFLRETEDVSGSFTGVNLDWNFSGGQIVYSDSNRAILFNTNAGPMPIIADTAALTGGGNIGVFVANDSQHFYFVNNVAPYVSVGFVMNVDGEPEFVLTAVDDQPASVPTGAALSFDYDYLVVAPNLGDLMVYSANGASLTLLDEVPGGAAGRIAMDETFSGGVLDPGSELLSNIVLDIHDRCNSAVPDVSELIDDVRGLVLAGDYTCADAVATLMGPYFFDSSEYDSGTGYKIHYPKRGKPVVRTITLDDIIEAPEKTVRQDSLERPKVLHLHYENPTVGYVPAKATIRRNSPDVLVVGERSLQLPVAFVDVDEPAQIADKLMKVVWVEVAGEEEFIVSDKNLDLVPSDCIGVFLRGQARRMRIFQEHIGAGQIGWRLIADRQSAYTSSVNGVPVPPPTPPLPSIVGQTVYEFMDLPALTDNDDRLIWYEAASGQTEAWYGAQTQRKAGAATEFENSATFNQNSIMGTLLSDVPAASEHYTDTTNVVEVQILLDDEIPSLTQAQFLSEGGAFSLENADGSWEILQYRDSDETGERTFELSHLARGRLNTGGSFHAAGSRFVLLDFVLPVNAVTAWIDTDMTNRAISFGTSADSAVQYVNTYEALSQTEFPVAHLFLELAGGTLTMNTVPRHRFGTEDNPVRSINWTGYRWTATDGANTLTADTTSETHSFDVTGWGSPITVTVAQLNRFTGAGPTVMEQI